MATDEHERILEEPAPVVLFEAFGDNSLVFQVYFWVRIRRPFERRQVESDLRFAIEAKFREAGITIAFPQRDVHLDTLRPLDVRVVGDSGPRPTPAKG